MATSLLSHALLPDANETATVGAAGGGGAAVVGVAVAPGEADGGKAVTVAVLVGPASSSDCDGHNWTMIQATRKPAARRSNRRRTYTERGSCLVTAPR
jgi:hypothetical protein